MPLVRSLPVMAHRFVGLDGATQRDAGPGRGVGREQLNGGLVCLSAAKEAKGLCPGGGCGDRSALVGSSHRCPTVVLRFNGNLSWNLRSGQHYGKGSQLLPAAVLRPCAIADPENRPVLFLVLFASRQADRLNSICRGICLEVKPGA